MHTITSRHRANHNIVSKVLHNSLVPMHSFYTVIYSSFLITGQELLF